MTRARDLASASPTPTTVSSTELGYLDGVTSAIQTQINSKASTSSPVITTPKITLAYAAKTTTHTFVSGDEGNIFSMNNALSKPFLIPTDAVFNFAIGTQFNVFWSGGAGQPTIEANVSGTTTVISTAAVSATPKLRVVNSMATAMKIAANSWIVIGDIA